MDAAEVRRIIPPEMFAIDGLCFKSGTSYIGWTVGDRDVVLDGCFSADELEAISWVMRHWPLDEAGDTENGDRYSLGY